MFGECCTAAQYGSCLVAALGCGLDTSPHAVSCCVPTPTLCSLCATHTVPLTPCCAVGVPHAVRAVPLVLPPCAGNRGDAYCSFIVEPRLLFAHGVTLTVRPSNGESEQSYTSNKIQNDKRPF